MSGFHTPRGVTDEDRAAADALRQAVWASHPYRDRLPERGLSIDAKPALTGTDPADIGRYVVITVRDPLGGSDGSHARALAERLGPTRMVGGTGLFQLYTADMDGVAVTVVATGSGAPELELALVEIMEHSDAEVLVYFGTAAGMHPYVTPGDVVISTGVVRGDGLTAAYVDPSYPAAPSYDVVAAFAAAARVERVPHRLGVTRSVDSDMLGNGRPSVGGYMQPRHAETIDYWVRAGVLCNDREASPVVTLGNLFGRRTGAVQGITDNYPSGKTFDVGAGMEDATRVLVAGLRLLAQQDAERDAAGAAHWTPRVR
ncbi:MAG: hypothetical protein WA971_06345 [Microbacterium sp.]